MSAGITVAIPTFDRPEQLRRTLQCLLPQLTDSPLLIGDNASSTPASEVIEPLAAQFPSARIRVVRHRANIGMGANIAHCFLECETDWLWILGDDDCPLSDAMARIRTAVADRPDCSFINFAAPFRTRTAAFETNGLIEFARQLDSFANALFISTSLYNSGRLRGQIGAGFRYAYSFAPQFAILLSALAKDGGVCRFAAEHIVADDGEFGGWSQVDVALGLGTLLEIPMPDAARKALGPKIAADIVRQENLACTLIVEAQRTGNTRYCLAIFDQIVSRLLIHRHSWIERLKTSALRLALRFPRLGHWFIFRLIAARFGRDHAGEIIEQRYGRARSARL